MSRLREGVARSQQPTAGERAGELLSTAMQTVFSTMGERRWLTGLVLPVVSAIIIGVLVVVVIGANHVAGSPPSAVAAGFPPARTASADFTATAALATRGASEPVGQVATLGATTAMVGSQASTGTSQARFFVSTNSGATWKLATVGGAQPAAGGATLVAAGGLGWVAVGGNTAWFSPNAQSWLPEAALPFQEGDRVTALTASATGFVAVGENAVAGVQDTPVVWISTDGKTWQRMSDAATGLTAKGGQVTGITHAASSGNVTVITGTLAGGGSAAWRSTDGGLNWTQVTIPAAAGQSAAVAGLAPLETGFVAVRTAGGATGAVYTSPNGTTWKQGATLATANGDALTIGQVSGGPAGAVVEGTADGLVIAFLSANGTTWSGTSPVGAITEHVTGAALTSGGKAVIAGTSTGTVSGSAAQQQPLLAVVGPQGGPTQVSVRAIAGSTAPETGINAIAATSAASSAMQVAAGSANGLPALWSSSDGGTTWTRATGATLTRAGDNQITGVTHGTAGWVAVGGGITSTGATAAGPPVVAGSANGRAWTAADGGAFGATGLVTSSVAAGTGGYVIVGSQAATGGKTIAAAWHSATMTGWQRATGALAGSGSLRMNAVTAATGGYVAVGSSGPDPEAWTSATGQTWTAVAVPLPAGAASALLRDVAANGRTVAAVGTQTSAAGRTTPFAAVSANGGKTWSVTGLPLPSRASGGGTVTALTAANGGFTATGAYGAAGSQDVAVWLLTGGAAPSTAWTVAAPTGTGLSGAGTQEITALTVAGTTLTGAGFTETTETEQPTIWQSPVRS
ncbi:MAG TPA: hypothetical protein VGG75_01065 [Trebonia sp.]